MSDIICVTNRHLCEGDFLTRIEQIAKCRPAGIILREKDLSEDEYRALAKQVLEICDRYDVNCILHTFVDVALELQAEAIHLPLPVLRQICEAEKEKRQSEHMQKLTEKEVKQQNSMLESTGGILRDGFLKKTFSVIGASCHSVEEAVEAQKMGCTYITAGHVFATDCKKGLPPRGLPFLEQVCRSVSIPVFAIGGIAPDNLPLIRQAGASGGCIMSGLMKCQDVNVWLSDIS